MEAAWKMIPHELLHKSYIAGIPTTAESKSKRNGEKSAVISSWIRVFALDYKSGEL